MADEAHRSQYGFAAKTIEKEDQAVIKYGIAKYLRDGLPNASFIGFTGTPIERDNASTCCFWQCLLSMTLSRPWKMGKEVTDLLRVPTGQAQSGRRQDT